MRASLPAGTVLGGRYRIARLLGAGGMGSVYEAVQLDLGRRVAVKVLNAADDPIYVERFRREALSAAALGQPNIVMVTDFQAPPGEPPFLVMELLTGESLAQAIARAGTLPAARVATIAAQVLAALEAAHESGIIHRDIKPDNVFLTQTPATVDFVKLLDFGIAKIDAPGAAPLTVAGNAMGTPAYASPEQARALPVDARTDLYALGATMYHALTGRAPRELTSAPTAAAPISFAMAPPLAQLRPDIPPALASVVDRAMALDPSRRFASAAEMRVALAAAATAPPAVAPSAPTLAAPAVYTPATPARKSNIPLLLATIAAAFGLVVLLAAGGAWWLWRTDASAPVAVTATAPTTTSPPTPTATATATTAPTSTSTSTATASHRRPSSADASAPPAVLVDAGAPVVDAGAASGLHPQRAECSSTPQPGVAFDNAQVQRELHSMQGNMVACLRLQAPMTTTLVNREYTLVLRANGRGDTTAYVPPNTKFEASADVCVHMAAATITVVDPKVPKTAPDSRYQINCHFYAN